jgi:hypothetical protein
MEYFGFSTLEIAGLVGVALYICGYGALQIGFLRSDGYLYTVVNGFAAGFVLLSLMQDFNLSSAIIQTTWIALSIIGITRLYFIKNGLRFTADERA